MVLALDLFTGFGGSSAAWLKRGWDVVRVDILKSLAPDVVADVRTWSWTGPRPDLIWASPPCNQYSRESMPWCRTGKEPDLSCWQAAERIVAECQPRFWIIENVRGAQAWHGKAVCHFGPFFLWGKFPPLDCPPLGKRKQKFPGWQRLARAKVPVALSFAVAQAVEAAMKEER